jgi:ribosomal silencing factor RsfS
VRSADRYFEHGNQNRLPLGTCSLFSFAAVEEIYPPRQLNQEPNTITAESLQPVPISPRTKGEEMCLDLRDIPRSSDFFVICSARPTADQAMPARSGERACRQEHGCGSSAAVGFPASNDLCSCTGGDVVHYFHHRESARFYALED